MGQEKVKAIYKHTREDLDFIKTAIRDLALCTPDELDGVFKRLKTWVKHPEAESGLSPLECIIRTLEKEAKQILHNYSYPTELEELDWMDETNTYTEPLSAKKVLLATWSLREAIEQGKAEEAAIQMMYLIFAAMRADFYGVLIKGIRAKAGESKGGQKIKQKTGILLAIREILKRKGNNVSREVLWRYFEKNHDQSKGQEVFEVGNYSIYYEDSRLFEETDKTESQSISKGTFYKYVTQIRPKQKSKKIEQ